MKICIDARMYGLEHAGIGRYVSNLVGELSHKQSLMLRNQPSIIDHHSFILLVRKRKFDEVKKEVGNKMKLVVLDAPHYSFKEQLLVPWVLLKLKPDLVHFPHFNVPVFYRGKFVVTIHDLIKHTSRGAETTTQNPLFYWFKYLGYKFVFNQAVGRATRILVPSKTIRQELVKVCNLPADKIVVTYEGADNQFQSSIIRHQSSTKILSKYKIKKPFVIYTGSLYPHKNVERLIQSIKLLNMLFNKPSITLIISCARSVFWERLKKKVRELGAEKFVNLMGFVPDGDLAGLYQEAEAFVFPTLSEGFGLPGLEAMAAGLPVVCSNIPVLREIYGEAAEYFNPLDSQDMAEKIGKVIRDTRTRKTLIEKGLDQAKQYSWKEMVQQTLKVYQDTA